MSTNEIRIHHHGPRRKDGNGSSHELEEDVKKLIAESS